VKKKTAKKALRLYDNEDDATERMAQENEKAGKSIYEVEFREGEDSKCDSYCPVAQWCPYTKDTVES
jgi:hypothetical protein